MSELKVSFSKDVSSALSDIQVLIVYLGRQPNSRLQSCFRGAPRSKDGSAGKLTPPSKTYSEFLNRISSIQASFEVNEKIPEEDRVANNGLTNAAFVLHARDFLSALSAPQTAESIRITNAYVSQRFKKNDNELDQYQISAAKTVSTVKWMQNLAFVVTGLIVAISIYALSGRQILSAKVAALATLKEISGKIELTQRQEGNQNIVNPALIDYLKRIGNLSSNVNNITDPSATHMSGGEDHGRSQGKFFLCDNYDVTPFYPIKSSAEDSELSRRRVSDINMPSNGTESSGRYYYYGSLDEITLCNERRGVLRQLLAISDELISWQRTVTDPLPIFVAAEDQSKTGASSPNDTPSQVASAGADVGIGPDNRTRGKVSTAVAVRDEPNAGLDGFRNWFDQLKRAVDYVLSVPGLFFGHFFGDVLGKSSAVSNELATPEICVSFLGTSDKCTGMVEYYGTIPDSILGCINLYILPCLFGFLGSATAGVKYIRWRIEIIS